MTDAKAPTDSWFMMTPTQHRAVAELRTLVVPLLHPDEARSAQSAMLPVDVPVALAAFTRPRAGLGSSQALDRAGCAPRRAPLDRRVVPLRPARRPGRQHISSRPRCPS